MQFSEKWLRTFVDPSLDSDALNHALTMAGLEVEGMGPPNAAAFTQVVIGQIISAEKHPDADRLQVCSVDVGQSAPLQIVCGAANARAGLKVPCALVGAALPGFDIKQAKVRGIDSYGMMCSAKELGLAEESSGLLELPESAAAGQDIRAFLELDDTIFALKLTPNRGDCLSITGIAREVAAITGSAMKPLSVSPTKVSNDTRKNVVIDEPAVCPRYCGRMISGVNAQAVTPAWMLRRLEYSGLRSISPIVDITNYVLLEQGQPLHAFDANKLQGDIHVRLATKGEKLVLLNQQSIALQTDMLVIADNTGGIALAGIMGGAATAVTDNTADIFLESAFFTPAIIAGKGRRIGISTDSSYRFERGVDYGNTRDALERASALILEICGGEAGPVTDVIGTLPLRNAVRLRLSRLVEVLGIEFDKATVARLLGQLGFLYQASGDAFEVTAPSYRFDISIEEDLIEEIARLHGYDNIPAIAPHAELSILPVSGTLSDRAWLRDALAASGYQEIVSYSFVDAGWERDLAGNVAPITLKNPIASNLSVMRTNLWGGLLDALVYNLNRKQERVCLFELGAAYFKTSEGYNEVVRISGLAYGDAKPEQWAQPARQVDFFDVKAEVDLLTHGRAQYLPAEHPALHPGQSAQVMLDNIAIGWLGTLHPKWQQQYQLPRNTVLFELDALPLLGRTLPHYMEVPKFPLARRDIAVIVDEKISAQALLNTMLDAKIAVINDIALFDVYRGKGIPETKKSLAFLVLMQDTQKTLTDSEADAVMAKLLDLLEQQHNVELRK